MKEQRMRINNFQSNHKFQMHHNDLPKEVVLGDEIAIDTESMGLDWKRDRLCLVQLYDGSGVVHLVKFDGCSYEAKNLCKLLLDKSKNKIFHYARFDLGILYTYLGVMTENIYCTKIASKIARTYTAYHGLKALCSDLTGVDLPKDSGTTDWGGDSFSDRQMEYACNDVLYLIKIKSKLEEILEREGRKHLSDACHEFVKHRVLLDYYGWEKEDIFSHASG